MSGSSRMIAAAVGGLALLCLPVTARAQSGTEPVARLVSATSGSIAGVVLDERGAPIVGAMVSAFGPGTAIAVTDRSGRFELRTLSPGAYIVRAHGTGFVGSSGQVVEVHSSARSTSSIALRRANTSATTSVPSQPRVLAAGIGGAVATGGQSEAAEPGTTSSAPATDASDSTIDDDHSEIAWRLRHIRRGVLRDVVVPVDMLTDSAPPGAGAFGARMDGGRGLGSSSGYAANLLTGMPLTGQFNLLTTGSFDSPRQLFGGDSLSGGIAYVALSAPVGQYADWSMRGALTQGDLSSWFVAGAYTRRAPGRHRYDMGLSYSTQRYDDNRAVLSNVTDGSRNVGAVYAFDTLALTSSAAVTYGARFSRYDYLADKTGGLLSPRVELAISPDEHLRFKALASSRALAPGAEEFLPPIDIGLWLPPQRTFSSLIEGRGLQPERTNHFAIEAERDFGLSAISLRAFHQHVSDQLVTMFGLDMPGEPSAKVGHYFVGNVGDFDATGWGAGFRTALASSRVQSSVEYSLTEARWDRDGSRATYMLLLTPSVVRPRVDRVQALSTSIETKVPETATRILVICRLSSLSPSAGSERPTYDSRFDVQVHQSLPFMDFSSARWEMLLAVRNTFREATPESSVYDELLVGRAPKRIVGGLTLRF